MKRSGLHPIVSGAVGTYLAAAELVRRGYIVSALSQTAKGIDILAADPQTLRPLAVQVKTSQRGKRTWMLNVTHERIEDPALFYVFVDLPTKRRPVPVFCIVPSAVVASSITKEHADWLLGTSKKGNPHRANDMRLFRDADGDWVDKWDVLKADQR